MIKPAPKGIRINLFLSQAGIASRRGSDSLIEQGKVRINGEVMRTPGTKVDPSKDRIEYKDETEWKELSSKEDTIIYALYKPRGFVTSLKPQGSSPIVRKLLPKSPRVFPIGRLDKDSEGLLLLTNDGDLAYTLTHPKAHIEKSYVVHCTHPRRFTEDMIRSYLGRIAKGVRIEGRKTLPAHIKFIRYLRPQMVELEITLREGRNRQIRKMLGSIDLEVVRLIRTQIGKLTLDALKIDHGEYKVVRRGDIV
jgi:23S rRNA pseudouridine2605 synthase